MSETEVLSLVYSELLKVLGGVAVVLAALSAFLGKVWINRIANRESQRREERLSELNATFEKQNTELKAKLEVSLQRAVFVDRLQFEHEYTIYKQAWEVLYSLRQATLQLRPTMDFIDLSKSEEERMNSRMNAFAAPFNSYRDIIEKNKRPSTLRVCTLHFSMCLISVTPSALTMNTKNDQGRSTTRRHARITRKLSKPSRPLARRYETESLRFVSHELTLQQTGYARKTAHIQ